MSAENPAYLPPYTPPNHNGVPGFFTPMSWMTTDHERFMKLLNEAATLAGPGVFCGDNIFTWGRNNSFIDDQPFREAWEKNIQNPADEAIVWRRYFLATMAYHAVQLDGDFVECGVYAGTGVKTVMDYLGGPAFPKTYWAYDTYDYNPVEGHAFDGQTAGFVDKVRERFNGCPQVKIVMGLLPDSFEGNEPERIAFLHIDLNNAAGETAVLERLFDRVVPGGTIILDDYEWAGVYRSQKLAHDPWFDARGYRVSPLPTGQGFVIKR